MRIQVTARPGSKRASVEMIGPGEYVVAVKEPPIEGRANQAIIRALAEHLRLPPSRVVLVSGKTGKKKVFEVPDAS